MAFNLNTSTVKVNKPDNLFSWISAVILVSFYLMSAFNAASVINSSVDILVFVLFLVNMALGIMGLWVSMADEPYSLKQSHWIFFLTFFVITPLQQFGLGVWPWGVNPSEWQIVTACCLVSLWGGIFIISSGRGCGVRQLCSEPYMNNLLTRIEVDLPPIAGTVLLLVALAGTSLLVSNIGLSNMFIRTDSVVNADSTSMQLLISVLARACVFVSFELLVLNYSKNRNHFAPMLIVGFCVVVTCFPTALARFNVAAIYLGIGILIFPAFSRKRGLFAFFLLIGFLVAYPVFNAFKYVDSTSSFGEIVLTISSSLSSGYTSGNYDAFSVFFWIDDYCKTAGYSLGYQLIGSLFFFVPRSVWPTKPIPSGQEVFSYFEKSFTDISCSLPWEGYINFGFIGLVAFAFIYGIVIRRVDDAYWMRRVSSDSSKLSVLSLYYPLFLSLNFYMLRGALMTTMTYVVGDLLVIVVLVSLCKVFQSEKPRRKLS